MIDSSATMDSFEDDDTYFKHSHLMAPQLTRVIEILPGILSYSFSFYLGSFLCRRFIEQIDRFAINKREGYRLQNLIICLFHSTVASIWLTYLFVSVPGMCQDWIHHRNESVFQLLSFSAGYFIHDAIDLLRFDRSLKSVELLAHHSMALVAFLTVLGAKTMLPFSAFVLSMEINSIFLHVRSIGLICGYRPNAIKWATLLTYIPFRFVAQIIIGVWLYNRGAELHSFFFLTAAIGSVFFGISNCLLFYRVLVADKWILNTQSRKRELEKSDLHLEKMK